MIIIQQNKILHKVARKPKVEGASSPTPVLLAPFWVPLNRGTVENDRGLS